MEGNRALGSGAASRWKGIPELESAVLRFFPPDKMFAVVPGSVLAHRRCSGNVLTHCCGIVLDKQPASN